jgi:hypothetical protein
MNTTTLISLALSFALVSACDNPGKAQKAADEARQEARENNSTSQRDTDQAKKRGEWNADTKQDRADVLLTEAKNEYRVKVTSLLTDIGKTMTDVRAANVDAVPPNKARNDANLTALATHQTALAADLKQIETTPASQWEAVQYQVDKDLNEARLALKRAGKT